MLFATEPAIRRQEGFMDLLTATAIILPLALLVFWAWMFSEMAKNRDLDQDTRSKWMFAFILLNVFAAAFYYSTIYSNKD